MLDVVVYCMLSYYNVIDGCSTKLGELTPVFVSDNVRFSNLSIEC
jgi:hypothetical protein